MEEFGTDSGVLLKASETGLSEWGQWVRHTFFWRGYSAKQRWEDSGFNMWS